jgi:hypothetical protein
MLLFKMSYHPLWQVDGVLYVFSMYSLRVLCVLCRHMHVRGTVEVEAPLTCFNLVFFKFSNFDTNIEIGFLNLFFVSYSSYSFIIVKVSPACWMVSACYIYL